MVNFKRASKELDTNRRHSGALMGNDRHTKKISMQVLERLEAVVGNPGADRRMWRMVKFCVCKKIDICDYSSRIHQSKLRRGEITNRLKVNSGSWEQRIGSNLDDSFENCTHVSKYLNGFGFLAVDTKSTAKSFTYGA